MCILSYYLCFLCTTYHANIHKALKYAVKIDLIPSNPADKVERPKKNEFKGSYYSADEIHALTKAAYGAKLEIPVLLASFYGLRRSSYNPDYLGYLCVDEIGNILRPNYVSEQFPKLLVKNGLRPIRFHDLRHSCASLLLANGVPMKQIQEWLGHSDFSTTANIYAHLDYASKLSSAQAMLEGLGYGNASA